MRYFPPFLRLALIASAAASIAYWIGNLWPGDPIAPVPAAVTAVVVTATSSARAWKISVVQIVGIAFGALVAIGAVTVLGYSAVAIAFMVLVSYVIVAILVRYIDVSPPEAAASIAISVIIVVGSQLSTSDTYERFLGVIVGAVVGFVLSFLSTTNANIDDISNKVDGLYIDIAALTADISEGVGNRNFMDAPAWYSHATVIRTNYRALAEPLKELETSSKWSPLISQKGSKCLQERYDSLGMTITRLVAVASDLKLASKNHLLDSAPIQVISPLARLLQNASQTLNPDEESASRADMNTETRKTITAASSTDMPTEELGIISGVAQNARRLVSLEDTQPLTPIS